MNNINSLPKESDEKLLPENGRLNKNLDPRIINLFKKAAKNIGLWPQWTEDIAHEAAQ